MLCLFYAIFFKTLLEWCSIWVFYIKGEEIPLSQSSSSNRDLDFESERAVSSAETPVGVLQEIAMKCSAKVRNKVAR